MLLALFTLLVWKGASCVVVDTVDTIEGVEEEHNLI